MVYVVHDGAAPAVAHEDAAEYALREDFVVVIRLDSFLSPAWSWINVHTEVRTICPKMRHCLAHAVAVLLGFAPPRYAEKIMRLFAHVPGESEELALLLNLIEWSSLDGTELVWWECYVLVRVSSRQATVLRLWVAPFRQKTELILLSCKTCQHAAEFRTARPPTVLLESGLTEIF